MVPLATAHSSEGASWWQWYSIINAISQMCSAARVPHQYASRFSYFSLCSWSTFWDLKSENFSQSCFLKQQLCNPPHTHTKQNSEIKLKRKKLQDCSISFFLLSCALQPRQFNQDKKYWERSGPHWCFLFKLPFSCPLFTAWHKRVWLVFASPVLSVPAWLLIWLLYFVDWGKRPPGQLGILSQMDKGQC